MKFELTTKTIHRVVVQHLELVPPDQPLWLGLKVVYGPLWCEGADLAVERDDAKGQHPAQVAGFEANWLSEVARTATDMLPMHGPLEGAHFYLGHFVANESQVAVIGKEMDNYGADDIVYNGWRVTVSAAEVEWGLD